MVCVCFVVCMCVDRGVRSSRACIFNNFDSFIDYIGLR